MKFSKTLTYCVDISNANVQSAMERKTANDKQFYKTIIVLCIFTLGLLSTSHALEANVDSCPVSRLTVQTVENCPDTEETWKEAAARKNCAAYASQCDEPERLEYHCVINSFINETLEVCAYTQNIVFGHCTDYSISGNLIKQNSRTNCKVFETKPCPFFYRSIEAYKYPGCYELTKRSKHPSPIHLIALSSIYDTLNTTTNSSRLFPAGTHRQEFDNGTEKDVFIISLILSCIAFFVIFAMVVFTCMLKNTAANRTKEYLSILQFV